MPVTMKSFWDNEKTRECTHITLGDPLDQLLNQAQCDFTPKGYESELTETVEVIGHSGGLVLPQPGSCGTGNVVIMGGAGSGKSTLAMQLAHRCVLNPNLYAAYISLEESSRQILFKASKMGWLPYFTPVSYFPGKKVKPNDDRMMENLREILEGSPTDRRDFICPRTGMPPGSNDPKECKDYGFCAQHLRCKEHWILEDLSKQEDSPEKWIEPYRKVIMPLVSPPAFRRDQAISREELFWERFNQLEQLLRAAQRLRKEGGDKAHPNLCMVCIDSLNVLGERTLTREALFAIFDLFKRYEMLGVFVVEKEESDTLSEEGCIDFDTVEFLTDMVIQLTNTQDQGYYVRHIEVTKSRYQVPILGKHPFKFRGAQEIKFKVPDILKDGQSYTYEHKATDYKGKNGLLVYPSVHSIIRDSERGEQEEGENQEESTIQEIERQRNESRENQRRVFGDTGMNMILRSSEEGTPSVVTIEGPHGTFKTMLTTNFLYEGLQNGESGLFLRLHDEVRLKNWVGWSAEQLLCSAGEKRDEFTEEHDLEKFAAECDPKKSDEKPEGKQENARHLKSYERLAEIEDRIAAGGLTRDCHAILDTCFTSVSLQQQVDDEIERIGRFYKDKLGKRLGVLRVRLH